MEVSRSDAAFSQKAADGLIQLRLSHRKRHLYRYWIFTSRGLVGYVL